MFKRTHFFTNLFFLVTILTLSACGGGGTDEGADDIINPDGSKSVCAVACNTDEVCNEQTGLCENAQCDPTVENCGELPVCSSPDEAGCSLPEPPAPPDPCDGVTCDDFFMCEASSGECVLDPEQEEDYMRELCTTLSDAELTERFGSTAVHDCHVLLGEEDLEPDDGDGEGDGGATFCDRHPTYFSCTPPKEVNNTLGTSNIGVDLFEESLNKQVVAIEISYKVLVTSRNKYALFISQDKYSCFNIDSPIMLKGDALGEQSLTKRTKSFGTLKSWGLIYLILQDRRGIDERGNLSNLKIRVKLDGESVYRTVLDIERSIGYPLSYYRHFEIEDGKYRGEYATVLQVSPEQTVQIPNNKVKIAFKTSSFIHAPDNGSLYVRFCYDLVCSGVLLVNSEPIKAGGSYSHTFLQSQLNGVDVDHLNRFVLYFESDSTESIYIATMSIYTQQASSTTYDRIYSNPMFLKTMGDGSKVETNIYRP